MNNSQAREIFDFLYQDIDGKKISHKSRSELSYHYIAETYGEVLFDSFYEILKLTSPNKNEVFYDLGSGTGRPSMVARLCFNFSKIIGVEKLEALYLTARDVLNRFTKSYSQYSRTDLTIDFVLDDFKKVDFTDADIIFMN